MACRVQCDLNLTRVIQTQWRSAFPGISLWDSSPLPCNPPPVSLPTTPPSSTRPHADSPWHSHRHIGFRQQCLPCAACHILTRPQWSSRGLELSDTAGPTTRRGEPTTTSHPEATRPQDASHFQTELTPVTSFVDKSHRYSKHFLLSDVENLLLFPGEQVGALAGTGVQYLSSFMTQSI